MGVGCCGGQSLLLQRALLEFVGFEGFFDGVGWFAFAFVVFWEVFLLRRWGFISNGREIGERGVWILCLGWWRVVGR